MELGFAGVCGDDVGGRRSVRAISVGLAFMPKNCTPEKHRLEKGLSGLKAATFGDLCDAAESRVLIQGLIVEGCAFPGPQRRGAGGTKDRS